jgi:hypothetical protein
MPEAPDIRTPNWRKSTRSGGSNNCVEAATNIPDRVLGREGRRRPRADVRSVGLAAVHLGHSGRLAGPLIGCPAWSPWHYCQGLPFC